MSTIHTFKVLVKAFGPAGESFVNTTIHATDALKALHEVIPAFPPVDQPDELEIHITLVPDVDPNE